MSGPLEGVTVVELAGLGPAPFGAMVLADLGADVTCIDRADRAFGLPLDSAKGNVYARGRRSVAVDLKSPEGIDVVRRLVAGADVFIEGFRPGVAERLGLGPDELRADHDALVYCRMTGWGQEGPLAAKAGHDLNYVGLAGPLAHIGRRRDEAPAPPLNLLADFGGGGLLLALGVCAALVERSASGQGQVIDAAMVDGVALLASAVGPAYSSGYFSDERGTNLFDGGAPYYDSYRTADGRWLSVAPLEAPFYADLLRGLGLADGPAWPDGQVPDRDDESTWPVLRHRFEAAFATRSRDEWLDVFTDLDACVFPVLPFGQVADHPHIAARDTWVELDGVVQPSPAPRFDRTPARLDRPPAPAGHHTDQVLADAGYTLDQIAELRAAGAVA